MKPKGMKLLSGFEWRSSSRSIRCMTAWDFGLWIGLDSVELVTACCHSYLFEQGPKRPLACGDCEGETAFLANLPIAPAQADFQELATAAIATFEPPLEAVLWASELAAEAQAVRLFYYGPD